MTGRTGPTGSARQPDPPPAAESVPGYRDLARIGHGGFSVVYQAVQESFERDVALKVLTVGTDEEARRRFMREVRLAGRLSGHPHVVTILDAGMTASGRPYLAMDLYDGGSMKERLRRCGPLSAAETALVGAKIADALAAAHSLGVLHRDVTPNNILVSRFGEPALADFGVSCLLDSASSASVVDIFSPQHAAPELMTRGVPTASSDVYALGSTLYQLLTGRPPFGGDTRDVRSIMFRVVSEPPPRPHCPELPELTDAIVRALAKEPEDRYPDAAQFARTLRALIPDGTPPALPMPDLGEAAPETAVLPRETASTSASGSLSTSASMFTSTPTAGSASMPSEAYRTELDTSSSRQLPAPDETMVRPGRADPSQRAATAANRRSAGAAAGAGGGENEDERHRNRRKRLPLILVAVLALLGVGTWALLESQKSSSGPRDTAAQQHSPAAAGAARATPTPTPTRPTASATPKTKHNVLTATTTTSATPNPNANATTKPSSAPPSASVTASSSSGSGGSLLPLPGTYHRLQNQQAGSCLTQSAALASCAATKSEGWQYSLSIKGLLGGDYELINEQTGACLAETSNGRVGAQACDGSAGQLWSMMSGSGSGKEFQNAGDRQCLQVAQAVVSLGSCSTSDRADLWNEDGTS